MDARGVGQALLGQALLFAQGDPACGEPHRSEQNSSHYDVNGNRYIIHNGNTGVATHLFYDNGGHVLQKVDGTVETFSLIVNDQVLGVEDKQANNVMGMTYTSLSSQAATDAPSIYTVQADTETLQTIAKSLWGDGSLWYVIADANGMATPGPLQVGQTLRVPTRVTTVHNTSDTFKPYSASDAVGDVTPLPVPSHSHGGCGKIGAIVAVVVAVVVTVYTAGAAAGWLAEAAPSVFSATAAGAAAAGAAVVPDALALAVGGAIGGAAGSIAGQTVSIAAGLQSGFDWKGVAKSAIGGAVSGAVNGAKLFDGMDEAWKTAAARAAVSGTISQGINIATGLQHGFDWRAVAASSAGAGVEAQVGGTKLPFGGFGNAVAAQFAGGVTTSLLRSGKVDVALVAADAFGNALGNSLTTSPKSDDPLGDFIQGHQKEWDAVPVGNAPKDSLILQTCSEEELRDAGIRLPTGTRFFVQPEGLTNAPSYNATSTPNQYADYDLSTKDGMRKFLDDKSWQISSGVAVSSDEIATAKAILSSYFGFEGNEKLMFKAWDNLNMGQVDNRFSFYTKEGADSALPFAVPNFGPQAKPEFVSDYSRKIVDTVATASDINTQSLTITSTTRTVADQARIMFGQLRAGNISQYGVAGRAAIQTYNDLNGSGASDASIRGAMETTIQDYLDRGQKASNHLGDPNVLNVFDIAKSTVKPSYVQGWEQSLNLAQSTHTIDRYLGPHTSPYDPTYHLEITQIFRKK